MARSAPLVARSLQPVACSTASPFMAWFKKSRKPIEAQADKSARFQRGCGSSAPPAPRPSTTRTSRPTSRSAPSAAITSASRPLERLRMLFDEGEFEEHDGELISIDPLHFTDTKPYRQRLDAGRAATGQRDAIVSATGLIDGRKVAVCGDGVRLHRRQHGRRGRRDDHARHRARDRRAASRLSSCRAPAAPA